MDLQKLVTVLKDHLVKQTPNYQDGDTESLLEMLFNVYTQFNGLDKARQKVVDNYGKI